MKQISQKTINRLKKLVAANITHNQQGAKFAKEIEAGYYAKAEKGTTEGQWAFELLNHTRDVRRTYIKRAKALQEVQRELKYGGNE